MRKLILLTFMLLFYGNSWSQDGWVQIHPYPTVNDLIDAHFISDDEGWIVGIDGLIMHTTDAGVNWDIQHSNPDQAFWSVFFVDDHEGWVCGWGHVYHTIDKGETWIHQNTPWCAGAFMDVFFINPDTGWIVGAYEIVLRTTNGGHTWEKIQNSIPEDKWFARVDFWDELHGCAVGSAPNFNAFVMVTDDGGLTWMETSPTDCADLTEVEYVDSLIIWASGSDGYVMKSTDGGQTWVDMYDEYNSFRDIHFFNDTSGILLSSSHACLSFDAGETWDSVVYASTSIRSFMSWEENKGIAVGFHGSMSKTLDGGSSWESLDTSLSVSFFQMGFINPMDGYGIYGPYTGGLARTHDGGYSWYSDTIFQDIPPHRMWVDGQSVFLINSDNQMAKTFDGGQNWEFLDAPAPDYFFTGFQFVNNNCGFLCGRYNEFYTSIDGGNTWQDKSLDSNRKLTSLFFLNENKGFLVDKESKRILRTTNAGDEWTIITLANFSGTIYEPVSLFFIGDIMGYASTDEGMLFKTTDGGNTWLPLHDFEYGNEKSRIFFVSENEGWYLQYGVYHTLDGGITWSDRVDFGLGMATGRSLFFLDENQGWMGGGYGLIAKYSGTVGLAETGRHNNSVTVFPNPARDVIQIFSHHDEDIDQVRIYDQMGKLVLIKSAGFESIDISNLSPGFYIVEIIGEGWNVNKKLIVE